MAKRINLKIAIRVYDIYGTYKNTYPCIASFLLKHKLDRKLHAPELRALRKGEVLLINKKHLILRADKIKISENIHPLRCKRLLIKKQILINKNKTFLFDKYKSEINKIVVIDEDLNVLGIHDNTMKQLSKKYNVPEGTIKSSLSRITQHKYKSLFPFLENRTESIYFIRMKDLPNIFNMKLRLNWKHHSNK